MSSGTNSERITQNTESITNATTKISNLKTAIVQEKTVTVNTIEQTIKPDTNYDYLSSVTIKVEKIKPTTVALDFIDNTNTSINVGILDTSNMITMASMFNGCINVTSLDTSEFVTTNVTDMSRMFKNCSSLTSLDLSSFDTANVTTFLGMFSGCSGLTSLNINNFDISSATKINYMFENLEITSLDLSNWVISNKLDITGAFKGCSKLTTLDISGWDFTKISYSISNIFANVPTDCLIYVKDETAQTWFTNNFPSLTNVQIKA